MPAESWPARAWRLLRPGGPLARPSDRWEARLVVTAILLALIAVPVCGSHASRVYDSQVAIAREQQAERRQVTAVVLEGAQGPVAGGPETQVDDVEARWTLPDGAERTGEVSVPAGTDRGARIPIWVNSSGDPVPAPMTEFTALVVAFGVGLILWLGVVLGLALIVVGTHQVLERVRAAAWARDWAEFGPKTSDR